MAITRFSGPLLVATAGGSGDSNSTPGPSAFHHGVSLLDMRYTPNGGDVTTDYPQWYSTNDILGIDQVPTTLGTAKLAALQVPVTTVPLTLASASTGITVVPAGGFQLAPGMPVVPAGALVIDGLPALINLGTQGGGMTMYDPRTAVSRAITITSAGADTGAVMNLVGADIYGQPIHTTTTMGSGSAVTTLKAFKFLISATAVGTLSGSNVSLGTSDVYGFPLAAWEFPMAKIWWNGAQITATTGFVAAVATTPTAATGDVRGTYAVQSASDSTKRLLAFVTPQAWLLTSAGIYGATQF